MGIGEHGRRKRAWAAGAALLMALAAGTSFAGTGDDCPPNPEPGKCYEKVYLPARYETYVEQVTDPSSGDRSGPAARFVTKQRRIREASFGWREAPCESNAPARRIAR